MNKAVMSAHVPPPPRPWESSSWLWVTNTLGVFHHIASLTSSPSFVWTFFLHQQQLDYKSDRKTAETGGLLIPGRVIKKSDLWRPGRDCQYCSALFLHAENPIFWSRFAAYTNLNSSRKMFPKIRARSQRYSCNRAWQGTLIMHVIASKGNSGWRN